MYQLRFAQAAVAALFISAHCAHAQILPQASPEDAAHLPLWELGVAAGVVSTPAYPGAAQQETRPLALPLIVYRGKVLRSDQSGIGARLWHTENAELDLGIAASLPSRAGDAAARAGMPNLGALGEFGPRLKLRLADFGAGSALRAELPLRAVFEVRGGVRQQGYTFEPRLVYEQRSANGQWRFETQLAAVVGDAKINRFFYAVQPAYVTPTRAEYRADAGLMLVRLGLFAARSVQRDLRLYGFLRAENYGVGANHASPLHQRNHGLSAGVGAVWTFQRSQARATP